MDMISSALFFPIPVESSLASPADLDPLKGNRCDGLLGPLTNDEV